MAVIFSGKVQMEVKGKGIERSLNECTRNGIAIFAVKKARLCSADDSASRCTCFQKSHQKT
ncbi:sporulation protein YqfD [Bacillus velezensis]|nr:sporulation protein YqfD [Bacillus velezensis]